MTERRILYGRRQGRRLRAGQKDRLDSGLAAYAMELPPPGERVDPARWFGRGFADWWLEVGFGGGEHLAWQATHHPDVGILGAEPFVNGVVSLLGHLGAGAMGNVRIHPDDARDLIDALPDGVVGRAFVLFPDPWPKARHNKRRFVSTANLDRLARVMRDGAELRLATDDLDYLDWMLEHATAHPDFRWLARGPDDWRIRPADWPPTRYEGKAIRAGRRGWYLRFARGPR
ncbi:MAG: tRNA (guanosine(46)-N(7))-methyltransferase TrmB [Alphaproteobacteria bacterium]